MEVKSNIIRRKQTTKEQQVPFILYLQTLSMEALLLPDFYNEEKEVSPLEESGVEILKMKLK